MQNNYFSNVSKKWLESKKKEVKITTYCRYEKTIENYLTPKFKELKISEISNDDIINFVKELANDYEYNTIKSMYITLSSILKYSGKQDIIKWRQLGIKKDKNRIEVLTEEESRWLNSNLLNSDDARDKGILLALNIGLRIGEICALKWKDIDLYQGSINVNNTMQRVRNSDNDKAKTKVILLEPKSKNSKRELPIPKFLYEVIKEMKSSAESNNSYILTGKDNEFIEPRNLRRYFKKRCNEILGREIKFHNLRHTYATISLSNNVDSKAVSETLGHSSVYTTLTFYQSVRFKDKYKAVQQLASVIGV